MADLPINEDGLAYPASAYTVRKAHAHWNLLVGFTTDQNRGCGIVRQAQQDPSVRQLPIDIPVRDGHSQQYRIANQNGLGDR